MVALDVAIVAVVAGLQIALLIYCLRMGVVGGGTVGPDAHRGKQPIRYWMGVTALALGASFSTLCFIYLMRGWLN